MHRHALVRRHGFARCDRGHRANTADAAGRAAAAGERQEGRPAVSRKRPSRNRGRSSQELQKQATQGGPGAPTAAPADPKKWDVSARHGPGRDVPIDTRTGTWMSLDVSPDGREIVFDLLGDIYVMPIGGGEARAITTGHAWDMQPRYSPSGTEIAFTSDRGGGDNIWVMDRNGANPRAITQEKFRLLNQPEWTPDGAFVVARKHFTSTRSLGAGRDVALPPLGRQRGRADDQGAHQAEGHERAGFLSRRPLSLFLRRRDAGRDLRIYQGPERPDLRDPAARPRDQGEVEPYVTGPGGAIRPTPSPDGKSLAFIRRDRYKSTSICSTSPAAAKRR